MEEEEEVKNTNRRIWCKLVGYTYSLGERWSVDVEE